MPPSNPDRKRRASKACSSCHCRKIRCDVLKNGVPCTKCRDDGFECMIRTRKRRVTRLSHLPSPGGKGTSDVVTDEEEGDDDERLSKLPPHVAAYQVPHYPFIRNLSASKDNNSSRSHDMAASRLDDSTRDVNERTASMAADDVQYLKQKNAFTLPPRHLLDKLVFNYFHVFHPFFPVVSKELFQNTYSGSRLGTPSLLLLQAMVFTSCASISPSVIKQMSYGSRQETRDIFYKRTKLLYEFDYERDDIVTIQSLLLMSHYYPSMTNQKHTWFWVQQAITLAQGIGLHRDSSQVPDCNLRVRLWWACLCRDRLVALGTGRPMHIDSLDCTVAPLSLDHLEEYGDSADDRTVKMIFVEFAKLCSYVEGILSLRQNRETGTDEHSLQKQIRLCQQTLQLWVDNLSPILSLTGTAKIKESESQICAMYRILVHMIYNIIAISLQQSFHFHGYAQDQTRELPLPQVVALANSSTHLARQLIDLDTIHLAPTICVTAILPPLIVQFLQAAPCASNTAQVDLTQFNTCLALLGQLGRTYWHASFYHKIFAHSICKAYTGRNRLEYADSSRQLLPSHLQTNTSQLTDLLSTEPRPSQELGNPFCNRISSRWPAFADSEQLVAFADCPRDTVNLCDEPPNETMGQTTGRPDGNVFRIEDWLNDFDYFYDFPSA